MSAGCEESNIDCKLLNDVVIQIKNKLIEQDYYEEKLIDLAMLDKLWHMQE